MLGETIHSLGLRLLIGFLGASISVSALVFPGIEAWLLQREELAARNVDDLFFLGMGEFLPWIFVWLLTIVIVGVQTERNALVLSIFAIGLPATLAGLCGTVVHAVR